MEGERCARGGVVEQMNGESCAEGRADPRLGMDGYEGGSGQREPWNVSPSSSRLWFPVSYFLPRLALLSLLH